MEHPIDITRYLPHREPFLMVDSIMAMDETSVETIFSIEQDNLFVNEDGFFTEAGLVENAAQTCSAIVAKGYYIGEDHEEKQDAHVIGFISAIKSLKVYALPGCGKRITTRSTLVSNFETETYSLCTMHCQTFCGEELLLDGEINLFIQQQSTQLL